MSTNTKAFIGIDAGTTGCTVMIFDEKGNALGHGYKEYPSESPYAGWGEQSLERPAGGSQTHGEDFQSGRPMVGARGSALRNRELRIDGSAK